MRTWISRLLVPAAVGGAFVMLATVAPAAPAGASAMSTTCATITRSQVSAALAKKAGAPKASTVGSVDTCTWTTKTGVKVTYAEHPLTAGARTDLDALAADKKNLVIAGVGDKSIAQCTKGGPTSMECQRFGKLYVLHGDQYAVVTLSGLPKGYSVENELTAILQLGRNSQGKA
jgi:hypothetical protein